MNKCLICGESYEKLGHLSQHIHKIHKILYKDYYDRFFQTLNQGICIICHRPTIFYKGEYRKYCSIKCQNNDPVNKAKNSIGVKKAKALRTIEQIAKENESRKVTNIQKYGVENISQLDKTKDKVEQTFKKHYGDWYLNTKECKKAFKDKFGADNALQVPEILEKVHKTNLERYGVLHPMQIKKILDRCLKNARKNKIYILPSGEIVYKQGYEHQFLDYVFQNNILKEDEIDYSPKGIKYIATDDKEHWYFPDFYIPKWNLIIEIKSRYILQKQGIENQKLKEKYTIQNGFKFLLILDDKRILNFEEFEKFIKN